MKRNQILNVSNLNRKNWLWYILPAIFSIIGGLVAYYFLKEKDASTAKNCLVLGAVLLAFYLAYYVLFWAMVNTFEFS